MQCADMERVLVDLTLCISTCINRKRPWATHLLQSRPQEAPDQELEALEFCLDDDEFEVRLRVHVPRLVFYKLNLPTPLALCMLPYTSTPRLACSLG